MNYEKINANKERDFHEKNIWGLKALVYLSIFGFLSRIGNKE